MYFKTLISKTLIAAVFLLCLLPADETEAGRYRQPAYVTNAYFTNRLIKDQERQKPDFIINVIRANYENTRGHMIIDLITDKGEHYFTVELLDSTGKAYDNHKFPVAKAIKDNFAVSLNLRYGGKLPANGIFVKIYDKIEGKEKMVLGTFRIMSEEWQ